MKRARLLRHSVDVWPVAIVLATTGLSLLPFFVSMPLWTLGLLVAVVLYARTFCAFVQHNHAHLPIFGVAVLNRLFDSFLTQTTGYPTALWELHHNRGHHRNYLDPDNDVASIVDRTTNKVVSRWRYALRGNLTIHRDSVRIGLEERRAGRKSLLPKLIVETLVQLAVTLGMARVNPWLTLAFFVVPNAIVAWMIWWESYPHHLGMPTTSAYDSSMTVEDPLYNLMTFNIGHHSAHHQKPTLHWSLLPARTAQIRHLLHESCIKKDYATMGTRYFSSSP